MLSISKAAFFLLSYERSPKLFNTSGGISWIISGDSMYLEYSVLITKVCEYDCTHSIYGGSGVFICKKNVMLMD